MHKQFTMSSWSSNKQLGKLMEGERKGAYLCGQRQQHQPANSPTVYMLKRFSGESLRKSQETDLMERQNGLPEAEKQSV